MILQGSPAIGLETHGNPMAQQRLGILFGGRSVEHEVSVITGYQAVEAADRKRFEVVPVYIGRDNVWFVGDQLSDISFFRQEQPPLGSLTRVHPVPDPARGKLLLVEAEIRLLRRRREVSLDVILPATHGTFVEDGCLQGLLELAGVPYAGSDVRGSAVGMDKELTKAVLAAAGLPHIPYAVTNRADWGVTRREGALDRTESALPYPLFVKPARLGSSVAVSRAGNRKELESALDLALMFCDRALVETALDGATEVNCAVLDGDPPFPSLLEQPVRPGDLLTFEEKYQAGGGKKGAAKGRPGAAGMAGQQRIIPAPLDPVLSEKVRDLAVATFRAIGAGGIARVDFLISREGVIYVNELNNIPGSFAYYLWEPLGKSLRDLIDRLVERAIEVNKRRNRTTFAFEANLLAPR